MAGIFEMFDSLMSFPKPLIAEVGGNAVGGGAIIAYTCDYRYMVDGKGRIGFAEPLVGLPITSVLIIRMRQIMIPFPYPKLPWKVLFINLLMQFETDC